MARSHREGYRRTVPPVGEPDAGLVAAPRLDDPDRGEQLLRRYGDRAYRIALRLTGERQDAEEAVEDALLTAARTIRSFTDESALGSWIDRTVAHTAYQRRKRRRHIDETSLDDVLPSLAIDGHFEPMDDWSTRIDEPTLDGELRALFTEAIDVLPADYGAALILHDVEGVSKPDIAEILEVDVASVKARVHRARLFVRKRLSDYFEARRA
jgi:RNA polymerase sigma-70 factor, ECF subfamily